MFLQSFARKKMCGDESWTRYNVNLNFSRSDLLADGFFTGRW